jgi:hypothetical protein
MANEAAHLTNLSGVSVLAAAGCGKTELIAKSVAQSSGRQLVLTHTNAGVEAIRRRLRHLGVSSQRASVDTLDGWCLKYVSSYPNLSGGVPLKEDGFLDWPGLRKAMHGLLDNLVIQKVIDASYRGAFVDEYQDCGEDQNILIKKLATLLPMRVLGDPLQAVFRFRDNILVEWREVEATFPPAMRLTFPWRWRKAGTNSELGEWLSENRLRFEEGGTVDLADPRITHVRLASPNAWEEMARNAGFTAAQRGGSVVAICKWPGNCQTLAKMTGGFFQCVESIEAKDAASMLGRLEEASGTERADILLDFLPSVAIHVDEHIEALRLAVHYGVEIEAGSWQAAELLRRACDVDSASALASALDSAVSLPGVRIYRRELLWAVLDSLRDVGEGPAIELRAALRRRRNFSSHIGRRLARCSAGTTLLVKGMEFDHAVVVHSGGPRGFTLNDLYVAFTRGAKSLTVLSAESRIDLRKLPRE